MDICRVKSRLLLLLSMGLLYADDLVLVADSMEELIEAVKRRRAGLEEKVLRMNLGKTK